MILAEAESCHQLPQRRRLHSPRGGNGVPWWRGCQVPGRAAGCCRVVCWPRSRNLSQGVFVGPVSPGWSRCGPGAPLP
eukprot:12923825-Prorocentrum_lima.AAC.1